MLGRRNDMALIAYLIFFFVFNYCYVLIVVSGRIDKKSITYVGKLQEKKPLFGSLNKTFICAGAYNNLIKFARDIQIIHDSVSVELKKS